MYNWMEVRGCIDDLDEPLSLAGFVYRRMEVAERRATNVFKILIGCCLLRV